MSNMLRAFFTLAAALAFAVPVSAQQGRLAHTGSGAVTATFAQTAVFAGPTMASAVFPLSAPRMAFSETPAALREPTSANVALMIVGGAALVLGAVIGGDEGTIIMIGGGGVGLLGLYRYLR
jgi:hypothetical protein